MGIPSNEICGLFNRTANLYNKKSFSDIEFRIKDTDGEIKVFYAHTLILATAGDKFAEMFYGRNRGPFDPLAIIGFTPYVFDLMLRFIYTDKIKYANLDDAMDVFKIARHYAINDLMVDCEQYLSQFQVDHISVFARYDSALVFQKRDLLAFCRNFVSTQTKAVFESPYFCKASRLVIEDILKLPNLSVSGELVVIEAALRWCKAECVRKKKTKDALFIRESFLPLCRYLRFLTLEIQDFLDFEETNKIFTTPECISLTAKILSKQDPKLTVPTEFCAFRSSRCSDFAVDSIPNDSVQDVSKNDAALFNFPAQSNSGSKFRQYPSNDPQISKYSSSASTIRQRNSNDAPLKEQHSHPPCLQIFPPSNSAGNSNDHQILKLSPLTNGASTVGHRNSNSTPLKELHSNPPDLQIFTRSNSAGSSNDDTNFSKASPKTILMANRPTYISYKPEVPQTPLPKSNGEPLYEFLPPQKKNPPLLRVLPQSNQKSVRSYEIPLHEMQKEIGTCFENDVKCNANIKMLRGTMYIHEIELRVKDLQKGYDEEIEVHLCLTNKSAQKSYSQKVQLKNGMLHLPFSEPIKVDPKNPLDIEVMIEELKLNRCSVCQSQEMLGKLNYGLNVAAEIGLRSNQSNGTDRFFFLVSKITFSIPKY